MKLSKFNYYKKSDNEIFIFNTLSEKIVSVPSSEICLGNQTIETDNKKVLLELQELGMIHEEDIDENRVYKFWIKRRAHDESCFRVNVFLDNNNCIASELFEIEHSQDYEAINYKVPIVEQIMSLSSMLFAYSTEINLINCEKIDEKLLKGVNSFIARCKQQFIHTRVNFAFNLPFIEKHTVEMLRTVGIEDAFLKILSGLGDNECMQSLTIFLNGVYSTDDTSPEIHFIIGSGNYDTYNVLCHIPVEFRDNIHVHFCLCPQMCINYGNWHESLSFLPLISSAVKLGYIVNPIEIVQYPCAENANNFISVLSDGKMCKCKANPAWILNREDGSDVSVQLYQHILSSKQHYNNLKECADCVFSPWCTHRCLIKCTQKIAPTDNCPKDLYEELACRIIDIWRQVKYENA